MHMVRGLIDVSQMNNGTWRPTLRPGFNMTFYRIEENGRFNTYAEVNHVRARIEDGDICVRNGIIHKLVSPIGFPTEVFWERFDADPALRCVLAL